MTLLKLIQKKFPWNWRIILNDEYPGNKSRMKG